MFVLVLPVHDNQCVIASHNAKCVRRDMHVGYEVRCYQAQVPFAVDLYDIHYDVGTTSHVKTLQAKRVLRKERINEKNTSTRSTVGDHARSSVRNKCS